MVFTEVGTGYRGDVSQEPIKTIRAVLSYRYHRSLQLVQRCVEAE